MKIIFALVFFYIIYTVSCIEQKYDSSHPYYTVAEASNPLKELDPKKQHNLASYQKDTNNTNLEKKKLVKHPSIRSLLESAQNLLKDTFHMALRPISSNLWGRNGDSYKRLESEYYVNDIEDPNEIKLFHKKQTLDVPYKSYSSSSFDTPIYSSEKCVCYSNISSECNCTSTKIHEKSAPSTEEDIIMRKKFPYRKKLLDSFKEDFGKVHKHVYSTRNLVKDGIRNAKKNLLSTTRMARVFTSAAAQKTLNTYENTTRSAKLLKDLVRRGIITPDSAAEELVGSMRDASKGLLEMGYINAKGAASYLMGTAARTKDSIVNTLKYSPTAFPYLKSKYSGIFKNSKFRANKDLPEIEKGVQRVKTHINLLLTPPKNQTLGKISVISNDNIKLLRSQWSAMIERTRYLTSKYKEKFAAVTNDLSRILDVLYSRLGDKVSLQVPGIESLKKKFNNVLLNLKNRNQLVLTGRYSIAGLLDYSMGIFNELKEIDKAILSMHVPKPYLRNIRRKTSISPPVNCFNCDINPLDDIENEEGYNHIFNQVKRETQAEVGRTIA